MIIAGLGNPGTEYQQTRHNVGFLAVDALARRYKVTFGSQSHRALRCAFSFKGECHHLIKPLTYMNLSGEAVSGILAAEQLTPPQLLVIVDDVNLPLGRVRLRERGSDGGHNGLKSIISLIGTDFWRLRIGIGQPQQSTSEHESLVDHVLGPMNPAELQILEKLLQDLPGLVSLWLLGRGTAAMGKFNGRDYAQPEDEKPPPDSAPQ